MSVDVVDPANPMSIYDKYEDEIFIYSFANKKDADEGLSMLKKDSKPEYRHAVVNPDKDGKFSIKMKRDKDARLLVWCNDLAYGYKMLEISECSNDHIIELSRNVGNNSNNSDADLDSIKDEHGKVIGYRLKQDILVTDTLKKSKEKPSDSVEEDGIMTSSATYVIPYKMERNMRVVVQPLWYDRIDFSDEKSDSVFSYGRAYYYDKFDYNVTQERRMDYDLNHDKLHSLCLHDSLRYYILKDTIRQYSRIEFTENKDTILVHVVDTLSGYDPNYSHPYPFGAIIKVFDYNVPVYTIEKKDDGERRSPLKYLDFSFREFLPDREKFHEELAEEDIPVLEELLLNFEVGKSRIVENDSATMAQLNKLRDTFISIRDDSKQTLQEVFVYGMASPEGSEEKNKELARERAAFVQREIMRYTTRPVEIRESRVAGWDNLADLLASDGYTTEASAVKDIVDKYPGNMLAQGGRIAALPYYTTLIKENYLPKLRTVRYMYNVTKRGQKPMDMILKEYREDPNTHYTTSEYWALFNYLRDSIQDKKELETVARNALTSYENNLPYAAALISCCYIARDTVDLNLLMPYLDYEPDPEGGGVKYPKLRRKSGSTSRIVEYVNHPEIAANQLIMTLKQHKRSYKNKIPILELMVNRACDGSSPYDTLLSFSKCLRGGYKVGKVSKTEAEADKVRRIVSSTSVTNRVVINLAVGDPDDSNDKYLNMALSDTLNLPDNPVSDYLKAIMYFRKGQKTEAEASLARCFSNDITKIAVASNDKDLISTKGDGYRVIENAFTPWHNIMEKMCMVRKENVSDTVLVTIPDSVSVTTPDSLLHVPNVPTLVPDEKHPYTWYKRALDSIKKSGNNNYEDAKAALFNCFDIDKRYIDVLVVSLKRDTGIRNNEELVEKLKGLLGEYKKKSKK